MGMPYRKQSGFTLVEMIMVIVITGILGGMAAMFLKAPIEQYVDVARRAELADVADTALRRLARDIRTAVPNSIRVPVPGGASTYIEYLPARDGGRYRAVAGGGAGCAAVAGDIGGEALDFTAADTCFGIIGPPITFVAGDQIVIGSTQSDGSPPYDATAAGIRRPYAGVAGVPQAVVQIPATQFPAFAELQSQRFDVVDGAQGAVTYACIGALGTNANGDGTASLVRYAGYGFNAAQVAPPFAGGQILANNVSGCAIAYDVINQRNGLVAVTLTITRGGENVSLHHEIHVNNAP